MKHVLRWLVVIVLTFGLWFMLRPAPPLSRAAGPWYVATTGSNANSCLSAGLPCATVNGVLSKPGFVAGDSIRVATGTYTSTASEVVLLNKNAAVSGGWDGAFTAQVGWSTVDGENTRRGVTVNSGVTATVEHFIIQHGLANGSGVHNSGTFTLTKCRVQYNDASLWPLSGSGVENGGTLYVIGSTISHNAGYSYGGGVYNTGVLILYGSEVSENTAGLAGGGIFSNNVLIVNNSTVTGNDGVMTAISASGVVKVNSSTIAYNRLGGLADMSGGLADITVQNSILAFNHGPDCFGTIQSSGYNIFTSTDGSLNGCTVTHPLHDLFLVDPLLGTLTGSPAFFPLLPSSPAVNAGNPAGCPGSDGLLTTDQRGVPRDGHCDIGAFEYVTPGAAVTLEIIDPMAHILPPNTPDPTGLKVLVLDSQGNLVGNVPVTFTAPLSGPSGVFATTGTPTATVLTDEGGIATAPAYTTNDQLGEYTLGASISGVPPVVFSMRNVIWYVSTTNGSMTNNCMEPETPCLSFWQLMTIPALVDQHQVRVAAGTYSGADAAVLPITHSLKISGGWNDTFTAQTGTSIIDGGHARNGIAVSDGLTVTLDRFAVRNALTGLTSAAASLTFAQGDISHSDQRGVAVTAGQTRLTNATLGDNQGGGLSVSAGSTVTVASSTIVSNRADSGGGIQNSGGTVVLKNSIVADNTISTTGSIDCAGAITSGGYSLIGNTTGCIVITATGDLLDVDPQLNAWLIGTPAYYALRSISPAIEAADPAGCTDAAGAPLSIDIRGVARTGRCDIGAYEDVTPTVPASLLVLSGTPQNTRPSTLFSKSLRVAVLDSQGTPVVGMPVVFTAPASGPSGVFSDTQSISTTSVTDADGVATAAPFQASAQAGAYHVVAAVTGVPSVTFDLFNVAAWYVSPTGNNSNGCLLPTAPCATLNGALIKAQPGDDIYVADGTYSDVGEAVAIIDRSVQLSGGWNAAFTTQTGTSVLDGQGQRRGVATRQNVTATLENFSIQNGNADTGGGLYNSGHLTVINTSLENNTCANTYGTYGGGVYNVGILNMIHTTVHANTCAYAGGILNDSTGILNLDETRLISNQAFQGRGGIENLGTLTMTTSVISDTSPSGLTSSGTAYITNTQFLFNGGGGLDNSGQTTLLNSVFQGNTGVAGGGLGNSGSAQVQSTRFISNAVSVGPTQSGGYALGGGVYNAGHLTMDASVIIDNQAAEIYVYYDQPAPRGGGLANRGVMTVSNSLIANNKVSMLHVTTPSPGGGGVYQDAGHLVFNNSTIVNNQALAQGPGGGLSVTGGGLQLHQTIVADNVSRGGSPDCNGKIDSAGYNLVGQLTGCTWAVAAGDQFSQTVGFTAPPTSTGYQLNYNSPAINAGDPAGCTDTLGLPLPSDLRGLPRPVGRCDIGAVEMQALEASAVLVSRPRAINRTPISYTLKLRNLADTDVSGVVLTDRMPSAVIYQPGSLTATQGLPLMAGDLITWTGTLSDSSTVDIVFGATVSPAAVGGSWITNTAYVHWAASTVTPGAGVHVMSDLYLPLLHHNFCSDFFDDFSNPISSWPVGEDAYLHAQYLSGEYQLLSKVGGYLYGYASPACAQEQYRVDVDARWASAAASGDGYALLFDVAPDLSRYGVFYVSADYGDFALDYRDAAGVHQIVPFTPSSAIQRGAVSNHLTVIRHADTVTLAVNGVTLGTWPYTSGNGSTRTGLAMQPYGGRPQADARFDNFSVKREAAASMSGPAVKPASLAPIISRSPVISGFTANVWLERAWSVRTPIGSGER